MADLRKEAAILVISGGLLVGMTAAAAPQTLQLSLWTRMLEC